MSVVIETTIGDLVVDLFTEERPVACLNFIKLCKLKYYNYNLFHTVEQGFIAQTGDPTGAGNGGSSVWGVVEGTHKRFFEAEYLPKIHHTSAGLLSLVGAGKNLVGSQFFFTLGSNLTSLDGAHCVIGEVVEGHETLRKLNDAIVDEQFRPYQDIRITHTVILDDVFSDPRGFQMPSRSPSPSVERLKNGRIAADEDIDDTDGKSMEEIQEMLAEREAKARATILEIVGDLPDAEMAPPENVLFVCKLNPVTTDDDLEIIFSRFGKVKGCEVIRDKKSGDSLQYAFVEFDDKKSCEAAYFKMDNVLIDDRRIHVDFSQSVAKVKWRGKGRGIEGPDGRIDFNNLREKSGHTAKRGRAGNATNDIIKMTSEERRRAREERHRKQEKREKQTGRKSHSREKVVRPRYDHSRNRVYQERRGKSPLRRDTEKNEFHERMYDQRHRFSRSRSRERGKRQSPTRRRHPEKCSTDRRQRDDPQERHSSNTDDIKRQKRMPDSGNTLSKKDKSKFKKDIRKKKNKKSKHATSSEDSPSDTDSESGTEESSSESETSNSSETVDSTSSEEERKKKKKSKKPKRKKSKSPKKKKKQKK